MKKLPDNSVSLDEFDMPEVIVSRDGKLVNNSNGVTYNLHTRSEVFLTDKSTGKSRVFRTGWLMRHLFGSPWATLDPTAYKRMSKLGLSKYIVTKDGKIWSIPHAKYLSGYLRNGYYQVGLITDKRGWKSFRIHRLVALMLVPNKNNKKHVNHKDGDKRNNHANNLEWVTSAENVEHAVMMGLTSTIYSDEVVHEICKKLSDGTDPKDIVKEYGVSVSYAKKLLRQEVRAHISGTYDMPLSFPIDL